jgi:TolB-like protein
VLPFENLSADAENEYFSDGITEDVLAQIAKISHLKVISRGAIRHYKNTEKSPREIGAELDVATLLMGTVRRDGDKLRVGCELVEAATGEQLWSGIYDRKMENVFAIQSEIAQQIAQTL